MTPELKVEGVEGDIPSVPVVVGSLAGSLAMVVGEDDDDDNDNGVGNAVVGGNPSEMATVGAASAVAAALAAAIEGGEWSSTHTTCHVY